MAFSTEQREYISQEFRSSQIIASMLILGLIVFVLIVVFFVPPEPTDNRINTYLGLLAGLLAVPASVVIPQFQWRKVYQALQEGREPEYPENYSPPENLGLVGPLLVLHRMRMIVGMA